MTDMQRVKVLCMVNSRFLPGLKFIQNNLNSRCAEDGFLKFSQIRAKATMKHIVRHWCFESTVANENHDGVNPVVVHIQEFSQALRMAIVLTERVLEVIFPAVNHLAPLIVPLIPKYPASVVFRFDHENAVNGHQNMINLGCAIAGRNHNIVDSTVNIPVQVQPHSKGQSLFPDPSF